MDKEETTLLEYKDVLDKIKNQECHLLLGNGFNCSLGVGTSYESIFQNMTEDNHGIYKDAKKIAADSNYDLEQFIGKLVNTIKDKNNDETTSDKILFLEKYIKNKVKLDFMKAAYGIVKSKIKNVRAEKNDSTYILLKNFTNYFTLNYDTFLYLLLLNFKSGDNNEEKTIAFQSTLKFIEEDMNTTQEGIFSEIEKALEQGKLGIEVGGDSTPSTIEMDKLPKARFIRMITQYSNNQHKKWKIADINRVVNFILEKKQKNKILEKIDDGSVNQGLFGDTEEFVFDINKETQNLFFLDGAFHIRIDGKDGKEEKKITQSTNKALYDRLEKVLNNKKRDIVCIFQPDNKIDEINKNPYLKNAYNKLSKLGGSMVVLGCSLSDNDNHIFEQINKSDIDTLYISTISKSKDKTNKRAKDRFPSKNIALFEAGSISYKSPDTKEKD